PATGGGDDQLAVTVVLHPAKCLSKLHVHILFLGADPAANSGGAQGSSGRHRPYGTSSVTPAAPPATSPIGGAPTPHILEARDSLLQSTGDRARRGRVGPCCPEGARCTDRNEFSGRRH